MFGLTCAGCGIRLIGESFTGPPREWFLTPDVLEIERRKAGWSDDHRCPPCQEAPDVR